MTSDADFWRFFGVADTDVQDILQSFASSLTAEDAELVLDSVPSTTAAWAGRASREAAVLTAAWNLPQVQSALRAGRDGSSVGPWVMFRCPYDHDIGPARLRHPGGPDSTGARLTLQAGRAAQREPAEIAGSQHRVGNGVIVGRDRWSCVGSHGRPCVWPGRAYRPDYLIQLHVMALWLNVRSIPVDRMPRSARRVKR